MIIVYIITFYFFIAFGVSRLIIPHLGFKDVPILEALPDSMTKVIADLKNKSHSKGDFLKLAYEYIGNKYRSERFNTILKFHYLFKPINEIWQMQGYAPCTQSNYLLKLFLIKSGYFKEEEIKRKHIFVNFVPHQYLMVSLEGKWIAVDVGEKQRGMKIGEHLKYFG